MKRKVSGFRARRVWLFLFGLLFSARNAFAAAPIQDKSLEGALAAHARLSILAAAESCLGTPYRYAGINRNGLDCSGLVYLSFKEALNYTIPRSASGIYDWAEKIPDRELQIGDFVFFVTTGPGVSHLGIYAGEGRFIHSASDGPQTGVIYSRLSESYWKRTYKGAGRALPWDSEAARAMTAAVTAAGAGNTALALALDAVSAEAGVPAYPYPGGKSAPGARAYAASADDASAPEAEPGAGPLWTDTGFYAGLGIAYTWGGFIEGAPSVFRGISLSATAGYKWSKYRVGLELRPEWDRALGVFRLPFTFSVGTDIFQVFAGPAYTFGDPGFKLSDGERRYSGGRSWLWEAGFQAAFPPIKIGRGALSFYGEAAWQPYLWEDGGFRFKADFTANIRVSTGVRYLFRLGK